MRLVAAARALARVAAAEAQRRLGERGFADVSPIDTVVLGMLLAGGESRATDLAARMSISKQALQLPVRRLLERGYVHRVRDPVDARAQLLSLTGRGREAALASLAVANELDQGWEAFAEPSEIAAGKELLLRLAAAFAPRPRA